jgi:hypothetical protein
MAFENVVNGPVGLVAAADLSTKQFYAVKVTADSAVNLAGDGEMAIGILQNKPTSGHAAVIAGPGSISKGVCGAAVTVGAPVGVDTDGKIVDKATADYGLGIALTATSNAGELVTVYVLPSAVANA